MAMITMVRAIKQIHSEDLVLIKIGNFYHAYGKDSYILSYLFSYKLKEFAEHYSTCGFPIDSISKVKAILEEKKINYLLLDKRNNYEEEEKSDNGNLNAYDKEFAKASKYIKLKKRIDNIYEILLSEITKKGIKETIIRIEDVINEGRKV
ncbi:MAG: hypothetical protein Q4G09_05775 [Clostridia bacterium]|nr:hypothetical protein [Clostridia bacterium]